MSYARTAQQKKKRNTPHKNEVGAIDLASIMIGIIVLGVIGGVVAATVFAVIPWSQDNAAKEQLKNVADAQAVYYAASLDGTFAPYDTLVKGTDTNAAGYDSGATLPGVVPASAGLVTLDGVSRPLSITLNTEKNCYVSVIQSASGKYYSVTNTHTNPEVFERGTTPGCVDATVLEREVAGAVDETPTAEPEPEVPEVATSLMVSTWDISNKKTIQLPVQGSIGEGSTINWGDGTVEPLTVNPSHTYDSGTAATVTIDGSFTTWNMISFGSLSRQLRTITQWDDKVGTTSLAYGFYNAINLTLVKEIPNTVTNLTNAFNGSTTFNGDLAAWDTSNVTNMSSMFQNASAFNQPVNFDTSNVTNMSSMFQNASAFNQPVNFDTSNATNMSRMFAFDNGGVEKITSAFNQPVNFDTSNATNMNGMFKSAIVFNSPVTFTDTSKVTSMGSMFQGASAFNQPLNFDTRKVSSMAQMFEETAAFNSPVIFTDTRNVTNMNRMFFRAVAFNQPVNFDTRKVSTMYGMFYSASAFNQPVNFDTRNVTDMGVMFYDTSAFNQNISGWDVNKVTTSVNFRERSALSTENTPVKFR